ncbi:hypothetical protein QUF75_14135 [Desulfococcaceae bacterium HSG7]|nr:hypothetical protein [Desulfococcaceae bacterium HSG7]
MPRTTCSKDHTVSMSVTMMPDKMIVPPFDETTYPDLIVDKAAYTACLEKNIPLKTQGVCAHRTVFHILTRAAAAGDSVENICRTMRDVPCG